MINKVILVGNLGKDPEVKHFEGDRSVAKFSIATNERYRDKNGEVQDQTEWHNVVVWNALAGVAEKYLKKGHRVYIEGKLTHRSWQDDTGATKYITEVVARTLKMLERRENSGGSGYASNMPTAQDAPKTTVQEPANTAANSDAKSEASDDLPF